jgi:uncharacterized protein (DUF1800 family)
MRRASSTRAPRDPQWAWKPFEPGPERPWTRAAVAHLHRRAGFAPSWEVLKRDLSAGPSGSVDRLLKGEPKSAAGTPAAELEATLAAMAAQLAPSADLGRIQAIWLYRMIFTPHPLRERMTLFWHNHFATSNIKVQSPLLMQRQNDLFRANALGDFRALLGAIGKDPAMLIWLDSTINRKAKPNENYAREVMELFTLGRGRYTERDIREAARAFTGWFVVRDQFEEVKRQHDAGVKSILGQTGSFDGDDIPPILLKQPACALFICEKLFRYFVSETDAPSEALLAPLAGALRDSGYQIEKPVEMILRSNLFFDPSTIRRRVKSPVEFAVGTIRALEVLNPTVATAALAESCERMGQSLYAPPSVAGWDGGPGWINSTAMLARANLALGLLAEADTPLGGRCNPAALASAHGSGRRNDLAGFFIDLLLQDALEPKARQQIEQAASAKNASDDSAAREVVRLVLTSPEYQLG